MKKANETAAAFESMMTRVATAISDKVREDGLGFDDIADYAIDFAFGFEKFNVRNIHTVEDECYLIYFFNYVSEYYKDEYAEAHELIKEFEDDMCRSFLDVVSFVSSHILREIIEYRAKLLFSAE